MSEVISDKDYISMVVRGDHKNSCVEFAPESIKYSAENIEIKEGLPND